MESEKTNKSALRLRLGIFFILLWWLPVWALSPAISDILGFQNNPTAKHRVLIVLVIIQTIFGLIGVIFCSREVVSLLKKVPRRKVLPAIWHVLLTGNTDNITIDAKH